MSKHGGHAFATDSALQRSVLLYRARKYPEAEATLTALLKTMPRNARTEQRTEATFYLGLCRARQKNFDKAVECFREVTQKGRGKMRGPEAQYWYAWCEKQRGQHRQAEGLYDAFIRSYPTDKLFPAATFELAELRFHRLQAAALVERNKPRARKRPPKRAKPDYTAIANMLRPLLAKDSKTPPKGELLGRVQYLLGWCLFKQEDWGPSAQAFEALIAAEEAAAKADRKHQYRKLMASACFQAGEARRRMKEFGPAKELFAKAAKLRGAASKEDQDDMLLRLAQLQAINNQWKESLRTAQTLLQQFPKSTLRSEALFSAGWAHENQKKYREAVSHYRQIVKVGVTNALSARAQFQTAECYFAQGQYDQAISEFNLVLTKYGFERWSSLALLGMGRSFQAQGKAMQARSYFDDVILKYPKSTAAELAENLLKKTP
jgi:TolA-binding protein